MEEQAFATRLTTQEKLLLAQAVHKLGALQWGPISKLLLEHPVTQGRPRELFVPEGCEEAYVGLMTTIGVNVPAEGATRPNAKVHLRLAQTWYLARMQELKTSIEEYETRFTKLMGDISSIKAGQLDAEIQEELRSVLARKYGKRLLDSWVPPTAEVIAAVEAGPGEDNVVPTVEVTPSQPILPQRPGDVPPPEKAELGVEEPQVNPSPSKSSKSELSPAPESPGKTADSAIVLEDAEEAEPRTGKRKAVQPPAGARPSKRAGRRGAPEAEEEEQGGVEEAPSEPDAAFEGPASPIHERRSRRNAAKEDTPKAEAEPKAEPEQEPAQPEPEPEAETRPTRGRRPSSRTSAIARNTLKPSPAPSAHTRDSTPARSRRAISVASTTASAAEDKRPKRGRPTKADTKREASVASERVEEESEERRTSARARPAAPEKRKRGARETTDDRSIVEGTPAARATPDASASAPNSAIISRGRPSVGRESSASKDLKSVKKALLRLHEEISGHKNGNVFAHPVKKSEAADYYQVVKRPMDLATIKRRIREGQISSVDEFERDLMLMFANSMMYNHPGSTTSKMTADMMSASENIIAHFRTQK